MMSDNEVVIIQGKQNTKEEIKHTQNDEEFIALDETEQIISSDIKQEPDKISKKGKIPNNFVIFCSLGIFIIFILLCVLILMPNKQNSFVQEDMQIMPEQNLSQAIIPYYELNTSRIEEMISKANMLYESGNKIEALKIYENVAIYNESLSYYNLGVSQMNQEKFAQALESFKTAIANQEHTDVSALNSAVCALHLGDKEAFQYYLNLSRIFLVPNSAAYSYYSALVNYYRGYYIEAYHILNSINDGFYANNALYLKSKILSLVRRDSDAIDALSQVKTYDVNLPLGLLNARLGKYDEAINYLNKVDAASVNIDIARLARSLIEIKNGSYKTAAQILEQIYEHNASFITSTYPIKVGLKDDYFNIKIAQNNFDDKIFFNKQNAFAILFHFTPFKIFNANQVMDYIAKGGINTFIDQSDDANEYLKTSGVLSKINSSLSRAIIDALNNELRSANKSFLKLSTQYPNHSELQYNLALSYAQLGDYANAYKYFIKSYHLNTKNHLAGIYAVVCSQIIGREYRTLYAEVLENINSDETLQSGNFYETLLLYARDNTSVLSRWLDENISNKQNTLENVFTFIAAMITKSNDIAKQSSKKLMSLYPSDIMTNVLYFLSHNDKTNMKEYAKNLQIHFFHSNFDLNSLYGGSIIVKEIFVKFLQISGLVEIWRDMVVEDLKKSGQNNEILQALAYIDLFTNRYQESYDIYNDLVHNKKYNDSNTLFLAAVASIGANHPQNAIAYLELAKITNPTDKSNHVALGLLYHEIGNIPAAIAQYNAVGPEKYKSKFFSFHLVN